MSEQSHPSRTHDASDISGLGTVLGIWAHPDDETYLTGGLLGRLTDAGHRVVCVTATRGEAANPDAGPEERAALAELRTEELEAALRLLGVTEHHWLDQPDGGCAELDPAGPASVLADLIEELRPDTVLTFGPDGFTGHPDHQAVSRWTDLAVERAGVPVRILHPVAPEQPADAALDNDFGVFELGRPRICSEEDLALRLHLSGRDLDRKVEALLRQISQTGGLVSAVGIERFRHWIAIEHLAEPIR